MVIGKDDNGIVEFNFEKRIKMSKWQSFKKALYDPSSNQILGRTPKNWGQLLLFYSIFYAVLAALFAICMEGLFASLDAKEPTWTLDSSLIGTNPGLGLRPVSNNTEEGSLIRYDISNNATSEKWIRIIDEFLEVYYKDRTGEKNVVTCDRTRPPGEGKVCSVLLDLQNCSSEHAYGYHSASPCIFLKLNKIFGWKPEFYKETSDMPDDLQQFLKNETNEEQIWVSCNGETDIDKENIGGFNYFPSRGFAGYYYPYKNDKNYLSPIIAVQIHNLTPNTLISIECRAWASNIKYRGGSQNRAGSVEFQIHLDAP